MQKRSLQKKKGFKEGTSTVEIMVEQLMLPQLLFLPPVVSFSGPENRETTGGNETTRWRWGQGKILTCIRGVSKLHWPICFQF